MGSHNIYLDLAARIVIGLKTKPEPIGRPVPGQTQIGVGGYRSIAKDDLVTTSR